jgi:hypothetical protein
MQAWVKLALISFLLFLAIHSEASPWEHGSSGKIPISSHDLIID